MLFKLHIEPAFLKSKVARRMFALFVFSALLPVVLMVVLALGHLGNMLDELGYRELANTSKSYGISVFERLQALETATETLATDVKSLTKIASRPQFRSVRVASTADLGLTVDTRARLASGHAVLTVIPEGKQVAHIVFLRQLDLAGQRTLVAEPEPEYLWGESDTLPYLTDICVLDHAQRTLFCSRPLPDSVRTRLGQRAKAVPRLTWDDNETSYAASYWALFLDGRFGTPGWTVLASQPASALRAPLETFWAVVLPALVVSLLVVVLLTVTQVRRRLVPLESLVQATRRIGNQDFSQPITIGTGDEFEELADALNAMAARLGRQFSALVTWSEVDRVILADPNIDHVLEAVLARLPEVVKADALSITVLEDRRLGFGRTYVRAATTRVVIERAEISAEELRKWAHRAPDIDCELGQLPAFLAPLARLGATSACTLPVIVKGELVAVIAAGHRVRTLLSEDDRAHLRAVADRVAVAMLAAERERQLYRQAHYDALSDLPNRLYLEDRLRQEIAHAQRERQSLALLFVDLDRFKDVNDTLGHAAGDDLLRQVAKRLRACVREADTVARLGGDEFAIVLVDIGSPRGAQIVAENVIRALSQPITVDGRETFINGSIGVTLYPADGANGEELLRKADTAMYRAKHNGRGRYVFFEERMNIEALERVALEQDLRRALTRDEFVLHFQPQVNLRTGVVIGTEALVRWTHPTRGFMGPDQFVTIAENAGLIESIGEFILFKACAQHSRWREEGLTPGRLAVNVSSRQLRQPDFWERVQAALRAANMPATSLELEITESVLIEDAPEVVVNFGRLQGMGVRLAIDDFGIGYSSLAYLKRLPIHAIKIDRVFMRDTPASDDAATIVETIIAMAQSLKKEVIAEGVETEAQASFLLAHGCVLAQGFGISRPLSAEDFAAYLRMQPAVTFVRGKDRTA